MNHCTWFIKSEKGVSIFCRVYIVIEIMNVKSINSHFGKLEIEIKWIFMTLPNHIYTRLSIAEIHTNLFNYQEMSSTIMV